MSGDKLAIRPGIYNIDWENRCGGARTGGHRLGVTAGARLRIEEALQVAD